MCAWPQAAILAKRGVEIVVGERVAPGFEPGLARQEVCRLDIELRADLVVDVEIGEIRARRAALRLAPDHFEIEALERAHEPIDIEQDAGSRRSSRRAAIAPRRLGLAGRRPALCRHIRSRSAEANSGAPPP